jgi:DNA modification methylase
MDLPLDTIICGDNCDVLGTLPRECIDLVVTSPPYDDLRTYGGHSWDFYGVAWQLKRVLKPGGVIVWVVNDETKNGSETGTSMKQALHFQSIGLYLHDTMIWRKEGCPFPETNRYYPVFEFMFVLSKGRPATCNQIADRVNKWAGTTVHGTDRQRDGSTTDCNAQKRGLAKPVKDIGVRYNVWEIPHTGVPGAEHPAPFPEDLARDHILSWSNEGDIVLDPFSGSGTTAKMARELGRHYIGIEVNESYVEISRKRLAQQLLFGVEASA